MARPSTGTTAAKRARPEPPRDTSRELLLASRRLARGGDCAPRPAGRAALTIIKLVSLTHTRARALIANDKLIIFGYVSYYDKELKKIYVHWAAQRKI